MTRQLHYLKCQPPFFQETWDGRKLFDLRREGRHFEVGDRVVLQEYDPRRTEPYTGREITLTISYILHWRDVAHLEYVFHPFIILGFEPAMTRVIGVFRKREATNV